MHFFALPVNCGLAEKRFECYDKMTIQTTDDDFMSMSIPDTQTRHGGKRTNEEKEIPVF